MCDQLVENKGQAHVVLVFFSVYHVMTVKCESASTNEDIFINVTPHSDSSAYEHSTELSLIGTDHSSMSVDRRR